MCLNFEKGHMLSECDSLHIETPPEFCITKEYKSRESLHMWFRQDFETFLAKMSQWEQTSHVYFQYVFWFWAPWTVWILRVSRVKFVKVFELGAQENRIFIFFPSM